MHISPIAHFRSPFKSKFGIPRQSGLATSVAGEIVMHSDYCNPDFVRGLEDFDYVWLIWGFSGNKRETANATVRPPLLGGNTRVGVFATRSPFRPNKLGLSSVRLSEIVQKNGETVIRVLGADLMDGTPIYDIKPYLSYVDSHADARCGFVDTHQWHELTVVIPQDIEKQISSDDLEAIKKVLALDPRPQTQTETDKLFGMPYGCYDVRFKVSGDTLTVVELVENQD